MMIEKLGFSGSLQGLGKKSPGLGSEKLGQSDFLKLLVTQLKHQDPLSPLKDRDFIAQMAQFSSLEQMTKVNKHLTSLIKKTGDWGIYQLLHQKVQWTDSGQALKTGIVDAIEKGEDGVFYLNVSGNRVRVEDLVRVVGTRVVGTRKG